MVFIALDIISVSWKSGMTRRVACKIICIPRNTTTLLAGIDLPTWQCDSLKGARLNYWHDHKKKARTT
jgi:hypothetical protein